MSEFDCACAFDDPRDGAGRSAVTTWPAHQPVTTAEVANVLHRPETPRTGDGDDRNLPGAPRTGDGESRTSSLFPRT